MTEPSRARCTTTTRTAGDGDGDPAAAVLAVRGLCKSIDDRSVLSGIDLSIATGELVGVLGANGAGKSTLLQILAMLSPPTAGDVLWWGVPHGKAGAPVRRRIGLIHHQLMLYRDLSAADNLEFFARLYGLPDPRGLARQTLDRLGLLRRADDPIKSFSRGMAQRVAIGRALLHSPDLILADEPFTGLDAPSVTAVEGLFAQLRDAGRTIVLVNHDIEQTMRIVDRVVVLRRGRVAIDRPTHRLFLDEVTAEVSAP